MSDDSNFSMGKGLNQQNPADDGSTNELAVSKQVLYLNKYVLTTYD